MSGLQNRYRERELSLSTFVGVYFAFFFAILLLIALNRAITDKTTPAKEEGPSEGVSLGATVAGFVGFNLVATPLIYFVRKALATRFRGEAIPNLELEDSKAPDTGNAFSQDVLASSLVALPITVLGQLDRLAMIAYPPLALALTLGVHAYRMRRHYRSARVQEVTELEQGLLRDESASTSATVGSAETARLERLKVKPMSTDLIDASPMDSSL